MTRPAPGALTGRSDAHVVACEGGDPGVRAHRDVASPFARLRAAAADEGFDLRALSGFRGFARQRSIWNRKARGELPVLDSDARPLDVTALTPEDRMFAILRWSALPGASRHHWGTDLDVYDAVARPDGYEIELVPAEVGPGGMFGPLHEWLDARMAGGAAFGFFRPYAEDCGGVAPERWHLSHGPTAEAHRRAFEIGALRETLHSADLELGAAVLDHLEEIWERFVVNVSPWTSRP